MTRFINPFTDVGFKRIFGQAIHKELLIDFLNDLLVGENFHLSHSPGKLRTDVVLSDRNTNEAFSDKLRFIFLQLPCFTKKEDECQTDFERWIYVLKNMETFQRLPFKARKSVFEKPEQIVDIASLSKEDRMKYDESIKVYRDHLVVLDFAKQEGLELGMRQGRAEGMAKGIEQGKNEGEMNEHLKNARRMKTKGYSIDDIADITGLSAEEINSL